MNMRQGEGRFTNARSQQLYYVSTFPPEEETVRGVVLFLHGIGEHVGRFEHVYETLCKDGFGVFAYDLVSHGKSDNDQKDERAHARDYSYFVNDTNAFVRHAKDELLPALSDSHASLPWIIMGMSFGGLVSISTLLSREHTFQGLVLAAPAVGVEMTPILTIQSWFAKPLSVLMPTARIVPGVNLEGLSRDKAFVEDYMKDPLVSTDMMTVRMGEQIMSAQKNVQKDASWKSEGGILSDVPVLMVQGGADKVVSVDVNKTFSQEIVSKDSEYKEYPELYHCIFFEPEKDQVLEYITHWLKERF